MKCSTPNSVPTLQAQASIESRKVKLHGTDNSWDLGQYFLLLAPIILTSSFRHASSTRAFNYIESIAWKQKKVLLLILPPRKVGAKAKDHQFNYYDHNKFCHKKESYTYVSVGKVNASQSKANFFFFFSCFLTKPTSMYAIKKNQN